MWLVILGLEHGAEADFSLHSSLALVWPTADEIERFANQPKAKRRARDHQRVRGGSSADRPPQEIHRASARMHWPD